MEHSTYKIEIKGTVQGVGFRPFIYSLASRFSLGGTVLNGSNGVVIVVTTSLEVLENFLEKIKQEKPSLACIDSIQTQEITPQKFINFQIISSKGDTQASVGIPADVSICNECEAELFDSNNRRYKYPFITCTQCGVRYSIIYDLPYDRANTSMKYFEMCKACEDEYTNPLNRRYHAQPIGCYDCGPSLELFDSNGKSISTNQATMIDEVSALLSAGKIVAIKGVGGYHLMCDSGNEDAINTLRSRKKRPSKPFGVMVKNIVMAKEYAKISTKEKELLESKERPIVLLNALKMNDSIAPNIKYIGLFLPYTPLHFLLLERLDFPLVATSANITDEPICTNLEDVQKLSGVYDYLLHHNREIVNGCDDSVLMVVSGQEIVLRRARGYAPQSVSLVFPLKENVLAMGANQKNTVAIGFENQVILSPHIGDLNSLDSLEYYEKNIQTLQRMYKFEPELIVHDKHPKYASTQVAKSKGIRTKEVQHHYAHILGVMAEKKLTSKVFGVAFDGTGYGDDRNLWGGEFMICDYEGYERVGHINYFKLLGGVKAIKEPRRVALSLLFDLYKEEALLLDNPTIKSFTPKELNTYFIAWKKGLNAPLSSSVGRLFDAVASLIGVCQIMSFEGESGMLLEALYDDSIKGKYTFVYADGIVDILPMLEEILVEKNSIKAVSKFFHTLVEIIAKVHEGYDLPLVLSGGVFQNRVLLELVLQRFPKAHMGNLFPPNDGGIALGQIVASGKD